VLGVLLGCGCGVRVAVGIGVEVAATATVAVAPVAVPVVAVGVAALVVSDDVAPDRVAALLLLAAGSPLGGEEFRLLESPPDPALIASV
jgi:hypothetical protein